MYDINHCTVNYLGATRGHSGILFGEDHVLTSASLILTNAVETKDKKVVDLIKRLSEQELLDFEVVKGAFKRLNDLTVLYIDQQSGELKEVPGQIRFLFNSRNAMTVLGKVLSGFQSSGVGDVSMDSSQMSTILSTFLLITIRPSATTLESKSEIQGNIMRHSGMQAKFHKGESIYTKTTPFGHQSFFDTKNHGIVSNILDETGSVMILSMPLCSGSEGGGVFTLNKDKLIGVILTAEVLHNNNSKDNVHLTLALRHDELLNELAQQSPFTSNNALNYVPLKKSLVSHSSPLPFERSTVLVDTGSNWGCGVFVTYHGHAFILTCSHVIQGASRIEIVWTGGNFTPDVIYKTEDISRPYDIALLSIPTHVTIPKEYFAPLAKYRPAVGSKVFCVGFPLFSSLANRNNFSPSIFNGFVTKYSTGILWTDAQVQAGQSGGPIFDAVGHLVGVCVSNTRDETTKKVFPNVNMAVPVCDVFRTLETYFETGNKKALQDLKANEEIQRKWNLEPQPFSSKL